MLPPVGVAWLGHLGMGCEAGLLSCFHKTPAGESEVCSPVGFWCSATLEGKAFLWGVPWTFRPVQAPLLRGQSCF